MTGGTNNLPGRKIWLTGASSGIGKAMAERLCEAGNHVIATARKADSLEPLKNQFPGKVTVVPGDISVPGSENELRSRLAYEVDSLDTVILNAGGCEYVDVDNYDHALVERVTQVNFLGFSRCLHASLPLLRKSSKNPHLVGISSASVFFGLPRAEAYGGTKAAMTYFLKSLRSDLVQHGIDVSIVYPGFVDTPLTRKNDFPMPGLMDTDTATNIILQGISRRKHEISFPKSLCWTLKVLESLPVGLSKKIAQRMVRSGAAA